jgi:hypothetical protein
MSFFGHLWCCASKNVPIIPMLHQSTHREHWRDIFVSWQFNGDPGILGIVLHNLLGSQGKKTDSTNACKNIAKYLHRCLYLKILQ